VDAAAHTINISHDPIKALGWPKMKMQFNVAPEVDLSSLKAGDKVTFKLKHMGEDDFKVVEIKK
jgi:Cu/Ag efflux protein CusF